MAARRFNFIPVYVCRTGKRGILGHFMIFRKNDLKLDS